MTNTLASLIWLVNMWPFDLPALCSTVVASGWGSTSISTWEVRWWSWWMTAPTSQTVSACPTSTPAMWWMATGSCTSIPTTEDDTTTWGLASTGASVNGEATTPGSAPSGGSWISKDGRTVLVKCLLFALFHTLNKMASVFKCFQFCSCSLYLEGMFPHEDVMRSWPDILTLIRGLNKILQALTLTTPRLKRYLLYS